MQLFQANSSSAVRYAPGSCRQAIWSGISAIAALALLSVASPVLAATAANAQSAVGANLNGVTYYSSEQPFLNIFKMSPKWSTNDSRTDTGEEAYEQLDSSGYPTTMSASSADPHSPQLFTMLQTVALVNVGNADAGKGIAYRAGTYVVLYDGQGTLNYGLDAQLVSRTAGQDTISVTTPYAGIGIYMMATDPQHSGNYLRNIRIVYQPELSLLNSGSMFNPKFLSLIKNFHVLRFMDWLDTNNSSLTNWASRPLLTDATWGTPRGVPIEVAVNLCNTVGADCWLNVPHKADDDYITQMAKLVHGSLNSSQKVYIEFSNEVWNYGFTQHQYAITQGQALWPSAGSGADYEGNWYGMRVAQMCDIWKSVWGGDSSRVVCVMGAFVANAWVATEALNCALWTGAGNAPCAAHGIGAVAIAPYFGFAGQSDWTSDSDGGLGKLFQQLTQGGLISGGYPGGQLKEPLDGEVANLAAIAPFKLPLIAYEAGQSFVGAPNFSSNSAMVSLYIAANRDARMGAAYTTALNQWKAKGGQTYMIFVDASTPSQYGEWGALESVWDTVTPLSSAPPKWQAIQNFIAANSCWWTGCSGTLGSSTNSVSGAPPVPMAPVLTVK